MDSGSRKDVLLEVCVDSLEGVQKAIQGGADRLELCSALGIGGLTPSRGFVQQAVRDSPIPINVLIRPRAGHFVYSDAEYGVMVADIGAAQEAGAQGVVIGANRTDDQLDSEGLQRLIDVAKGMDITLHRAFDLVPDFDEATELAISLGIPRILTSGGEKTALEALPVLQGLADSYGDQISIMPGSGINRQNASRFVALNGVREIHASCSALKERKGEGNPKVVALGFDVPEARGTSSALVRELKDLTGR